MEETRYQLTVREDGAIHVDPLTQYLLQKHTGTYELVTTIPDLIVGRRDTDEAGVQNRTRVIMAGEIITRMTVVEIASIITSSNWRGDLHVWNRGAHRMLTIDQGALKHAMSNHIDDRLGEVLYGLGVLTRAQLDELLAEHSTDRIGRVLVSRGFVDTQQLFQYLQKQAEQVFFNALLTTEGHYLFGTSDETGSTPPAAVHLSVQHLLMEGVQRIDEMALFRERIPRNSMCPVKKNPEDPMKVVESKAQALLPYCDGQTSIRDIARKTGLGEFEATKSVYHLLQQGIITLRSSVRMDEAALQMLISKFNEVMRDIFVAVATYGRLDATRKTIFEWINNKGYQTLFEGGVDEDGSLQGSKVLQVLRKGEFSHPMETLHRALHELAAFALLAVTSVLPRDQEAVLTRDVNRRLKAMRL